MRSKEPTSSPSRGNGSPTDGYVERRKSVRGDRIETTGMDEDCLEWLMDAAAQFVGRDDRIGGHPGSGGSAISLA